MINKVILLGRNTKDIEVKMLTTGKEVVNFTLAVANLDKEKTSSFFNCVAWGKTTVVVADYVKKGDRVAIIGELYERKFQTKNGETKSSVEINVSQVELIEKKTVASKPKAVEEDAFDDNDLPF